MCTEFGDPDLMITFTFVNDWTEVKQREEQINSLGFDTEKMDIRFCPYEEIGIWNCRFYEIYNNGFERLIQNMNFV